MTGRLPTPSREQLLRDHMGRQTLERQRSALLAGVPAETLKGAGPVPARRVQTMPHLLTPVDHLKGLQLYRKSVRAKPVLTDYQPQTTWAPVMFKWNRGQRLTKLARPVGAAWVDVLTSISTTSLAGGQLRGNQGRNLVHIVQKLRALCYLRVDGQGRPVQVREQVKLVVEHFARSCGMSVSTFYAALRHPLAHLFLRTQKVQVIQEGSEARRNVATLFTVSMYEPEMPADLEVEFYAEPVETPGVFIVSDYTYEIDRTKERPLTTLKQGEAPQIVENLGLSLPSAMSRVTSWLDSAPLGTKRADGVDLQTGELEGCLDRLRRSNPAIWEQAVAIAVEHETENALQNGKEVYEIAAIGYYKAIVHLGMKTVIRCVKAVERYRQQGQTITNRGALLTGLLNREARAATGFNLRDLGTEKGQVLA